MKASMNALNDDSRDPLIKQFGGKFTLNPEALAKIDTKERREGEWVQFIRSEKMDSILSDIALSMYASDSTIKNFIDRRVEEMIKAKALTLAKDEMAQNPPQNRVEQQIRTVESIALEWENFMRWPENVEIIMGFRKKAAESVYPILSAQIKQVIDQKAENKIYELAQEIAQQDVIDRETAASRSAVLTRAGLPLD